MDWKWRARSGLVQLVTLLGLLVGGAGAGGVIGTLAAPDSLGGVVLSAAMLPVALFIGVTLWLGSAVVVLVARLARGVRPGEARFRGEAVPPGAIVFVPSGVLIATITALSVSVMSERAHLTWIGLPYVVLGGLFGMLAWRLAQMGYLPCSDGS